MGGAFNNLDYVTFKNKTSASCTVQAIQAVSQADAASIALSSVDATDPALYTTAAVHGFLTGQTITVDSTTATPVADTNGTFIVTVLTTTTFTVSLNGVPVAADGAAGAVGTAIATYALVTLPGHGLEDGRTASILLTDSTPVINGSQVVNVLTEDIFEVPIATTVAGTAATGTLQSEVGTDSQPQHVSYYCAPDIAIVSISLASPGVITTTTPHNLVSGDRVYLSDTDSTPALNGGRVVTVLSSTTFEVGVDTTGAGTANTGIVYIEKYGVKEIFIDSYTAVSVSGMPVYKKNVLQNQRLNLAESRFEDSVVNQIVQAQRTSNLNQLPIIDSRFSSINLSGHSTTLASQIVDINDTGNTNWLLPAAATTLSIVSSSGADGGAGAGISAILLQGLDVNLDPIIDVIVMNGSTPVISNLPFRSMHLAIALSGGTPGSGAVGIIDISSTFDASIWATFRVNDTAAETGRFVVPNGTRFLFTGLILNSGPDGDMTLVNELTVPGQLPISLGDVYLGSNVTPIAQLNSQFLQAGYVFKFRAKTTSGSPATRKINASMYGVLGSIEAWDSIMIM